MNKRCLAIIGSSVLLGGCISDDMASLQAYIDEVKSRKGGYIEPLPEIKPAERYLYQSMEKRDPFSSRYKDEEETESVVINSEQQRRLHREIRERNKEELEQFELDSLRLVGTLEQSSGLWGIVKDPDGTIYRVKEGNYLGRNYGKILSVSEEKIELREIIKDLQGAWEERQASIALSDDEV
ncbi:MAG: pilus assembly protein PilP [Gammaproteobacteria bacterium]